MDRTYFLVPGAAPAQRRPYKLLLEAMEEAGVGAIGRFVRSGRESLCLVRARGRGLVLETLYLVEDVYSQAEIDEAMERDRGQEGRARPRAPDRRGACGRLRARGARERVPAATSARCSRRSSAARRSPSPSPTQEPVAAVDLIEALKASVAAAKGTSDRKTKSAEKPKADRRAGAGAQGRAARALTRGPAAGPLESIREEALARGGLPAWRPTAWSCAWNRCLSILPW